MDPTGPEPADHGRQALTAMRRQLDALVDERNRLHREIGVSDADGLITMIRSLEAQLTALYETYGGVDDHNRHEAMQLLDRIRALSWELDNPAPPPSNTRTEPN